MGGSGSKSFNEKISDRNKNIIGNSSNSGKSNNNDINIFKKSHISDDKSSINKGLKKTFTFEENMGNPLIGYNIYGEIRKYIDNKRNEKFAIKIINLTNYFQQIGLNNSIGNGYYTTKIKDRISEIKSKIDSENVINYNDNEFNKQNGLFQIWMELCNNSLKENREEWSSDLIFFIGNIFDILSQLNNVFKIMSQENIVHGNLELQHILIKNEDNRTIYKLSSFEIIPELVELTKNKKPEKICKYLPPEALKNKDYHPDQKTDLWSLGVIIYYLCFKEFPYKGKTSEDILKEIEKNNSRKKTNFNELDDLICKLLTVDKEKRLTWEQYFNHAFFTNNGFWKYIIYEKIGEGPISIIYKIKTKNNNQNSDRALKLIDFEKIKKLEESSNQQNVIKKEIKDKIIKMKELSDKNNTNFITIYEIFEMENILAFSMELCDLNLKDYIDEINKEKHIKEMSNKDLFNILSEINKCLEFLRNEKIIIIGDLKLENILLKKTLENYAYKITDVGLCPSIFKLIKKASNPNALWYLSPELLKNDKYEIPSDLWSLGNIIHYIKFGRFPYDGDNCEDIIKLINLENNRIGSTKNEKLKELIEKLLEKDTKKRLDWIKYFNHPFFERDFRAYYTFKKDEPIFSGAYYSLYKGESKDSKRKVIIKIVNYEEVKKKYKEKRDKDLKEEYINKLNEHLINQVNIMKILNNENTVKLIEDFKTQKEFVIIMEECETNLSKILSGRDKTFNLEEIKILLQQLNKTFRLMVENKIIHGDLKLENILVNKEGNNYKYKLTDFGGSNEFLVLTSKLFAKHGKPVTTAPEILSDSKKPYDLISDLWSLGIILYTLVFRTEPYLGDGNNEVLNEINSNGHNKLKSSGAPKFDHLIRKLLTVNRDERITWKQYFEHPFISENDYWDYYKNKKLIGSGPYYNVYEVELKDDSNQKRAIKVINLDNIREKFSNKFHKKMTNEEFKGYIEDFVKETYNMELLKNSSNNIENIHAVKFYEYFQTEKEFCIVQELCDGSLKYFRSQREDKNYPLKEIKNILTQLNETFHILDEKNLSHKDLRLEKILIKKQGNENIYKLTGLEFSRKVDKLFANNDVNDFHGYKAPEILRNKLSSSKNIDYSYKKADIWSLGIIIYVLYYGKFPFDGVDDRTDEEAILISIENSRLKFEKNRAIEDLIGNMLKKDPNERIDWKAYFNHSFFH